MEQETTPERTEERPQIEPIAYSTAEAAKAAKVNPATIYRAIARGKLRASKHIRHKRILRTELERWLLGEPIPARHRPV
jgi:excisionase family DNA binding protein